jgi:hypothetical protein
METVDYEYLYEEILQNCIKLITFMNLYQLESFDEMLDRRKKYQNDEVKLYHSRKFINKSDKINYEQLYYDILEKRERLEIKWELFSFEMCNIANHYYDNDMDNFETDNINYEYSYKHISLIYNKARDITNIANSKWISERINIENRYNKDIDMLDKKYKDKPIPENNLKHKDLFIKNFHKFLGAAYLWKMDRNIYRRRKRCVSCKNEDNEISFTCFECNLCFCIKCEKNEDNYNIPICYICHNLKFSSVNTDQIYDIDKYKYSSNETKNEVMTFICCLKIFDIKVPKFIRLEIIKFISIGSKRLDPPHYIKDSIEKQEYDIPLLDMKLYPNHKRDSYRGIRIETPSMHKLTKRQQSILKHMNLNFKFKARC